MKFKDVKIGQKLHVIDCLSRVYKQIGIVVGTSSGEGSKWIEMDFGKWTEGHYGSAIDTLVKSRWYLNPYDVEPVESEKIPQNGNLLPTDPKERKQIPIGTGVIDYFSAALAEVAKVSFAGNEQHNPGEPLHWARGKSADQYDTMIRHSLERGALDSDGQRHSAKMVWRALAILQLELEAEGAPIARGAK
jgi:hypothetical protein